jgi:hypothetical protein
MYRWILPLVVLTSLVSTTLAEDDEARKANLARRAAEKEAAEKAVKELSARNYGTLTADEFIRLAYAYNELGNNHLALDAICRVSDDVLAEKKQLDMKATCFHNANSGDDKSNRLRELAFIDRCLDKKYGNQGVWLWRKARVVCQSSVDTRLFAGSVAGEHHGRILDREQYEYSFELLQRAFAVEPKLLTLSGIGPEFTRSQDFPLLSDEARFKELMKE